MLRDFRYRGEEQEMSKLKSMGFAECFYCMGTGTAEDEYGREGECAECGGLGEKVIKSSFFEKLWAKKFKPFRTEEKP